jgi:hypothetical protein
MADSAVAIARRNQCGMTYGHTNTRFYSVHSLCPDWRTAHDVRLAMA